MGLSGLFTWVSERGHSPGMVNLRKNREYAYEVGKRLFEEKRQELKNGTSGRDLLSLLGSSCVPFTKFDTRLNVQFFSQGKFILATRVETGR
jgi:hypothetical protein